MIDLVIEYFRSLKDTTESLDYSLWACHDGLRLHQKKIIKGSGTPRHRRKPRRHTIQRIVGRLHDV
jgi:hypothetical protein